MKILTFDTSLNKTYISYGEGEKILVSKAICSDDEKYHSAYLIPEIINILKTQNIRMQDIDVIGINEGPGSFTGIRICTVIARVAAQQLNIKVVPTPSLEILSYINKFDKKSLILLDARKNKAYSAIYDKNHEEIIPPHCITYDEIENVVKSDDFAVITDNSMYKLLAEKNLNSENYEAENYPLGEFLYKITYKKQASDKDFHWAKAKPLYIQPPSITMHKKAGA